MRLFWGIPLVNSVVLFSITVGPFISLIIKDANKNEYYFYYNYGISKYLLFATNIILNILSGIIIMAVYGYAKSFGSR
jgi:hypothetical protein